MKLNFISKINDSAIFVEVEEEVPPIYYQSFFNKKMICSRA